MMVWLSGWEVHVLGLSGHKPRCHHQTILLFPMGTLGESRNHTLSTVLVEWWIQVKL